MYAYLVTYLNGIWEKLILGKGTDWWVTDCV